MKQEIESELLLYWVQYRELEEKGGPEQDGALFEEIVNREEDILKAFGLPPAQKNIEILWKLTEKKSCTPKAIQEIIELLQQAAQLYHELPVVPSLQLLTEALENGQSSADILPELGFITHIYTEFLYSKLLITNIAGPEAVLKELQTVHSLDLYGSIARLQFNLRPFYRRTKAYKDLKSHLQFLDQFLQTAAEAVEEEDDTDLFEVVSVPFDEEPEISSQSYLPEYLTLLGLFEIEEIIFDEDTAVTVIGSYYDVGRPKQLSLGFEFEQLHELLLTYGNKSAAVLVYFNKSRQLNAIDSPTIIDLKAKTGATLFLDQHYLTVYKPQALNRDGEQEEFEGEFYIVDSILEKKLYNEQQQLYLQNNLNGYFHHIRSWYHTYLLARTEGICEKEARENCSLQDDHLFEISQMLYLLEKHGGKAQMRE